MNIKMLIASDDLDYTEHLSKTLANNYSDVVAVSVSSSLAKLDEMLKEQKYDITLLEASFYEKSEAADIVFPLVLWADDSTTVAPQAVSKIRKYQRISTMFAEVLENYAGESMRTQRVHAKKANVTAVWSPSGGVGKTAVALAMAAFEAAKEKRVIYINLESFSSGPAYFDMTGKSISALFEMLEANEGNLDALIQSLLCKDSVSGIAYFCCPNSFDDINILSVDNISALVSACSGLTQELVIDMSCQCDERARHIFELADRILLVLDKTGTAKTKLEQFMNNHSIFSQIKDKVILVANKGAVLGQLPIGEAVQLPKVESTDETKVFRVLATSLDVVDS